MIYIYICASRNEENYLILLHFLEINGYAEIFSTWWKWNQKCRETKKTTPFFPLCWNKHIVQFVYLIFFFYSLQVIWSWSWSWSWFWSFICSLEFSIIYLFRGSSAPHFCLLWFNYAYNIELSTICCRKKLYI